jgi:DNA polymerase/3'-5' exonuclease PolX
MQYSIAIKLANEIKSSLTPFTEVIHIAGSLRRRCAEVKDIEVVCIPKKEPRLVDMFASALQPIPQFKDMIRKLMYHRVKGMEEGNYMQFILAANREIKVDLFMPRTDDYYRILAIRTGSTEYAQKVIAAAWVRKGWCGVAGEGLRLKKDCQQTSSGQWILMNKNCEKPPKWESEEAFFHWLDVPYILPQDRDYLPKHLAV